MESVWAWPKEIPLSGVYCTRHFPYFRDYNYSDTSIWTRFGNDRFIDIGMYPNSIHLYFNHLEEINKIFEFYPKIITAARKR